MTADVLFRTPNWLGDAVMATVVPPALRRGNPGARVGVLVPEGLGDVYRASPDVDEVLEFAAGGEVDAYRHAGYHRVLLGPASFGSAWRAWRGGVPVRLGFGGSGRAAILRRSLPSREDRRDRHHVENYRALAGLAGESSPSDEPRVALDPAWCVRALAQWGDRPGRKVALQPGATYGPAKRWPAERFATVARRLLDDGCRVAILGGPGDAEVTAAVVRDAGEGVLDLSGRTSVGVLAAVLAAADVLVTNDTGPMHLAAAVGTPVVAIFGSTDPGWTGPRGDGNTVIRRPVDCSPCFRRTCDIGYVCLVSIEVEEVYRAALGRREEGA